jgi:stearoyl-CoA desaturase (delta-9 desaturase)
VSAIVAALNSIPFTQLRRHRYFYVWYDGFYAVVCLALIVLMRVAGWRGITQHWDHRYWLLLPFACYFQILCSVFIHNCTHNNFPRAINRLIGEICGVVVLTRFASWEVIHQRHHKYSDNEELDPHPVIPSYWKFTFKTILGVERQLQRIFFELHGGDNPINRAYEQRRAWMSYFTNVLLLVAWYTFLGPIAFFFFFGISSVVGFLHLVHFNWCTHAAFDEDQDFRPVNLNHGLYRIGNFFCCGIYMHANHHKKTNLFNPARMQNSLPLYLDEIEERKRQAA